MSDINVSPGWDANASPISKLPAEVICAFFKEVFLSSLQDNSFNYYSSYDSVRQSNTLSHVCRAWRHLAIDDPSLWTYIHLTPSGMTSFSKLCLKRSKQSDLDICYADKVEYDMDGEEAPAFDPAVLILHRCRTLELCTSDRTYALNILSSLKHETTPKMVCLEVMLDGQSRFWIDPEDQGRHGDILTGGAPLLTSIRLEGISLLQCHVPLSNVTKLALTDVGRNGFQNPDLNASEFVGVLREVASTLKILELDGSQVFFWHRENRPWSEVELPTLVELDFADTADENREECEEWASNFWKFVKMPVLENLFLSQINASQMAEVFTEMKGDRGARVKTLSLTEVNLEELDEKLSNTFPGLQSLVLDDEMVSVVLPNMVEMDKECAASGDVPDCPQLQHLALNNCIKDSDVDLVQSFVLGRKASGYPIKRIEFSGEKLAHSLMHFVVKNVEDVIIEGGLKGDFGDLK